MVLLKSIGTLVAISTCIALLFCNNKLDFLKYFASATLIQVILYQIYLKILKGYYDFLNYKKLEQYNQQGVEITCPCYREKKALIPIKLNQVNDYKCLDCNKNVSVNVDVKTFLATEPLDGEATDLALLKAVETIKKFDK
jgi:hypothetical protein